MLSMYMQRKNLRRNLRISDEAHTHQHSRVGLHCPTSIACSRLHHAQRFGRAVAQGGPELLVW